MSGFTELVKIIARTSNTEDCIEWPGAKHASGYGMITVDGVQWIASRYVKMIADDLPFAPKTLVCRHSCDNPPCINPKHLSWGTNLDNSNDKVVRGRHAYGSRVAGSKMTEDTVVEARRFFIDTGSLLETRRKYNLTINACRQMLMGKTWKHVPGAISEETYSRVVGRKSSGSLS